MSARALCVLSKAKLQSNVVETIAGALGSLKAALEISKIVAGAAVDAKVREQQREITGKLIEAQGYILQMQSDHAAALRRADEAEAELVQVKAALTDLEGSVRKFVYGPGRAQSGRARARATR